MAETAIESKLLFCVKRESIDTDFSAYSDKINVEPDTLISIKFKGEKIQKGYTIAFKLGAAADAAITSADIGKIRYPSDFMERVKGKPGELKFSKALADGKEFEIKNFTTSATEGISEIYLKNGDTNVVTLSLNKAIDRTTPIITSFKADRYFVASGLPVTLSWDAKNVTGFELIFDNTLSQQETAATTTQLTTATVIQLDATERTYTLDRRYDAARFTLVGIRDKLRSINAYADVTKFGKSTVNVEAGFFLETPETPRNAAEDVLTLNYPGVNIEANYLAEVDGTLSKVPNRVLNIFTHALCAADGTETGPAKMYAFVQSGQGKVAKLYTAAANPRDPWEKVILFEGGIDKDIELDVDIASKPCAVIKNSLMFTAGSSFYPDDIDNSYCIFDMVTKKITVQAVIAANGVEMIPRMGHACVMHNSSIWILGGYNPDYKNAFNDIWKYSGTTWEKMELTLTFGGRCQMAACSRSYTSNNGTKVNELWLFGGYTESPCGNISSMLAYIDDQLAFNKIDYVPGVGDVVKPTEYNGVSLQVMDNQVYLFADNVYKIHFTNNLWLCEAVISDVNWRYPRCGHKLQAVTFANVIWLNALHTYNDEARVIPSRVGKMYYAFFV